MKFIAAGESRWKILVKSMTGYGRGEYGDASHRFVVEIKTVNHRYSEVLIRMPKHLNILEDRVRRAVSSVLSRGRIDVSISLEECIGKRRTVRVDKELAIAYHNALKELADALEIPRAESLNLFVQYPEILQLEEVPEDSEVLWPKLETALNQALANISEMRAIEGETLARDILDRIANIEQLAAKIAIRAPETAAEYLDKLRSRVGELLKALGVQPDESRLLQEVALYAEKSNITEEVVRLKSHLSQFRTTITEGSPAGRKLDFIMQEINREANTIASKADDFMISSLIIAIKSEIDKVREQIQNIE